MFSHLQNLYSGSFQESSPSPSKSKQFGALHQWRGSVSPAAPAAQCDLSYKLRTPSITSIHTSVPFALSDDKENAPLSSFLMSPPPSKQRAPQKPTSPVRQSLASMEVTLLEQAESLEKMKSKLIVKKAENRLLSEKVSKAEARLAVVTQESARASDDAKMHAERADAASREVQQLRAEKSFLITEKLAMLADKDALVAAHSTLAATHAALVEEHAALAAENARLVAENTRFATESTAFSLESARLDAEKLEAALREVQQLRGERSTLATENTRLATENARLTSDIDVLISQLTSDGSAEKPQKQTQQANEELEAARTQLRQLQESWDVQQKRLIDNSESQSLLVETLEHFSVFQDGAREKVNKLKAKIRALRKRLQDEAAAAAASAHQQNATDALIQSLHTEMLLQIDTLENNLVQQPVVAAREVASAAMAAAKAAARAIGATAAALSSTAAACVARANSEQHQSHLQHSTPCSTTRGPSTTNMSASVGDGDDFQRSLKEMLAGEIGKIIAENTSETDTFDIERHTVEVIRAQSCPPRTPKKTVRMVDASTSPMSRARTLDDFTSPMKVGGAGACDTRSEVCATPPAVASGDKAAALARPATGPVSRTRTRTPEARRCHGWRVPPPAPFDMACLTHHERRCEACQARRAAQARNQFQARRAERSVPKTRPSSAQSCH